MVLVSYPDSDSDSNLESSKSSIRTLPPTAVVPRKRKAEGPPEPQPSVEPSRPPPLPSTFHSLYATNVRTSASDDPSLHSGRRRQVVHVQGNWPSHVYLEWLPTKLQLKQLDSLIFRVQNILTSADGTSPNTPINEDLNLNTFLRTTLSAQLPLHISLSAPLVLTTSSKDSFRGRLMDAISNAQVGTIAVRPASLDLVPNFEKSRWFLVVRVVETEREGSGRLARVLKGCNGICEAFGLGQLYAKGSEVGVDIANRKRNGSEGDGIGEDVGTEGVLDTTNSEARVNGNVENSFHVSIAWMLNGVADEARRAVRQVDLGGLEHERVEFDRVKVKIGNVVDDVFL